MKVAKLNTKENSNKEFRNKKKFLKTRSNSNLIKNQNYSKNSGNNSDDNNEESKKKFYFDFQKKLFSFENSLKFFKKSDLEKNKIMLKNKENDDLKKKRKSWGNLITKNSKENILENCENFEPLRNITNYEKNNQKNDKNALEEENINLKSLITYIIIYSFYFIFQ